MTASDGDKDRPENIVYFLTGQGIDPDRKRLSSFFIASNNPVDPDLLNPDPVLVFFQNPDTDPDLVYHKKLLWKFKFLFKNSYPVLQGSPERIASS